MRSFSQNSIGAKVIDYRRNDLTANGGDSDLSLVLLGWVEAIILLSSTKCHGYRRFFLILSKSCLYYKGLDDRWSSPFGIKSKEADN